jgi:hypothetical protein
MTQVRFVVEKFNTLQHHAAGRFLQKSLTFDALLHHAAVRSNFTSNKPTNLKPNLKKKSGFE